jgi:hypothetical protein
MLSRLHKSRFSYDPAHGEFRVGDRTFRLPQSRIARLALGGLFILGGIFSFLPILGLWMLPIGLLILSQDLSLVRRWRRKAAVAYARRRRKS